MGALMDLIARAMGWILRSLYDATLNYGLAIILFTVFIKLILIPLTLKQQRAMKQSQELQPLMEEIQRKYANNQEKMAMELQKLYTERKVNPMAGCLLLLIQLPLIYAMFFAVAQPVKFMYPEIQTPEVTQAIEAYAEYGTYKELYYIANERTDLINMNFIGLDLGQVPNFTLQAWATLIIPILSAFSTFLTSLYSMKQAKSKGQMNEQAEAMQRNMMIFMPLMILMISFKVPLGMSLYWFVSTLITFLLQLWTQSKLNAEDKKKKVA